MHKLTHKFKLYYKPPFRMYNFDGHKDGWYVDDRGGFGLTVGITFKEAYQLWYALNKTYTKLPINKWPRRNF